MSNPIAIGPLLTQGLRNEFATSYEPSYRGVEEMLKDIIWFDATSDKISELYGQYDSPIYPVRWDPGNAIGSKSILSRQYRIQNRDFGRRVYLPRNYEDDQTGQAMNIARGLGRNWARLPEKIFSQYIQGQTNNDLLPAVPNSADGNGLYISSTRYGSSDGNVVAQSGSATVQQIITDIYSVLRRFAEFQDTESEPYFDDSDIRRGMTIFYGTSLTLVFEQALNQMVIQSKIAGTSTTDVSTSAGASNVLLASGRAVTPVSTQRITTSSYYCFLKGLPVEKRPIVRQVRKGQSESVGNWETSDHTRDMGEEYVQFRSREGWGSMLAIGTIRVS